MQPFTKRAQLVLVNARKAAVSLRNNYIGTEHLLLGILMLGEGVAVNVLRSLGLDIEDSISEIRRKIAGTADSIDINEIPYTPRAKKALVFASNEATRLGHNYIGTEHLLLAIMRVGDGFAFEYLRSKDIEHSKCLNLILRELSMDFVGDNPETPEDALKAEFLKRLRSLGGDYFEYYSVYLLERYSLRNGRRLEGLRAELEARSEEIQAQMRAQFQRTAFLGPGRMIKAFPRLRHGSRRLSLDALRELLRRKDSGQDDSHPGPGQDQDQTRP